MQIFEQLAAATILPQWIHVGAVGQSTGKQVGVSISWAVPRRVHEGGAVGLLPHRHLGLLLQLEAGLRADGHQALQKVILLHSLEGVRPRSASRRRPIESVLGCIEGAEIGPHGLDTLTLVGQTVLGSRLRGQLVPLVLHWEERLGLRLAHCCDLGVGLQALQVPDGQLGEGAVVTGVLLHPVGVTGPAAPLLLPSRTWQVADGRRRVYGDSFHGDGWVGRRPRLVDLW